MLRGRQAGCDKVSSSKEWIPSCPLTVDGGFNELRPELNTDQHETSKAHGSH